MSDSQSFILRTDNARARMAAAWQFACQFLELAKPVRVTVEECRPTRSLEQNAKFHAICHDLERSGLEWAGKARDTEAWKRLLVDAWARCEHRTQGEIVPSLDGQSVVNLGIQTRKMKVGEMAELIEFSQAWAIDHDVPLGPMSITDRKAA